MNNHDNNPKYIQIRGARVHNLKNINVDIPIHQIVGIAGVSGSGKSSLALGVLYAEGPPPTRLTSVRRSAQAALRGCRAGFA